MEPSRNRNVKRGKRYTNTSAVNTHDMYSQVGGSDTIKRETPPKRMKEVKVKCLLKNKNEILK